MSEVAQPFLTKRQVATQALRHAIRIGRYEPGQPLKQNDIARDLGLSSTPVREALSELTSAGLLIYEQHRGARVATLDVDRVQQIYVARRITETETARLSFEAITDDEIERLADLAEEMRFHASRDSFESVVRLDEAFHQAIFEASRNEYLVAAIQSLWDRFPRYFMWNIPGRIELSLEEHDQMVAALKAGDQAQFLSAVSEHLDHGLSAIIRHLRDQDRTPVRD